MIHNTAIVSPEAQIGNNVEIGPFTIVEKGTVIEDGCKIGAYVTIAEGTILRKDVQVYNNAVLGTTPQDLKFGGEKTTLEIGERTVIREFAFLNRGTTHSMTTKIGSDCLIMGYVHVAHDCFIGNNCILVNGTQVAGHVTIGNWAILSGNVLVHQFTKIGDQVMIEGGAKIKKDVPPYVMIMGEPSRFSGLNKIGLSRRGFSKEQIQLISDAYRVIYREKNNASQAIIELEKQFADNETIKPIIDFLKNSERGLIKS